MRSKNILIVEDDEDIREILRLVIELEGYVVHTASNGQEGLEALAKIETPCLILLDLMMPVMDGWAFAEALEKDKLLTKIPFVIVSAFGENASNIKKARGTIKKPVDLALLKNTIKMFCG